MNDADQELPRCPHCDGVWGDEWTPCTCLYDRNRAVIATEEKAREYAEQAEAHSIDYRATVEPV